MTKGNQDSPLFRLKKELQEIARKEPSASYCVPELWKPLGNGEITSGAPRRVNPAKFFLEHIEAVEAAKIPGIIPGKSLNQQISSGTGGSWIAGETIFNLFVRLSTAYDHDQDGKLGGAKDPTLNADGIRETGTFLKSIALLGHIKRLGATTIHLLPVTSIGHDGNKGVLGSPYAIRNPYQIESTLADPLIDMNAEDQFKAFIEACHLIGIRVICEFVFRTASKDSDWISEHPEWFYWIDARIEDRHPAEKDLELAARQYGNPIFDTPTLARIKEKVDRNDFHELPPPPEPYRRFFKLPPEKGGVKFNEKKQFRGTSIDPETGKQVETRIPGAFADWPPDDNQPPWGDVTYLKMYLDADARQPRFNYIAYNTIRMYDTALAKDELANRPLWNKIHDLIPAYQDTFGIDGVMVDMGHAVPVNLMREIVETARSKDHDFAFLSENFSIDESSVKAGYNAVVGYAWWVEYHRQGLHDLLCHVGERGVPLPYFGAVENHNTPRAAGRPGGTRYARYAFLVNSMLPMSIPFIHSGFELGETMPVNTGLDFKNEDLERLKSKPLALFDICSLAWDQDTEMTRFTQKVLRIRDEYKAAVMNRDRNSFVRLETGDPDLFCFLRRGGGKTLMVLLNRDLEKNRKAHVNLADFLPHGTTALENRLEKSSPVPVPNGTLVLSLSPGESTLFTW